MEVHVLIMKPSYSAVYYYSENTSYTLEGSPIGTAPQYEAFSSEY